MESFESNHTPEKWEGNSSPERPPISDISAQDGQTLDRARQEGKNVILAMKIALAREYGLYDGPADNESETIDRVVSPDKAEECLRNGECVINHEAGDSGFE